MTRASTSSSVLPLLLSLAKPLRAVDSWTSPVFAEVKQYSSIAALSYTLVLSGGWPRYSWKSRHHNCAMSTVRSFGESPSLSISAFERLSFSLSPYIIHWTHLLEDRLTQNKVIDQTNLFDCSWHFTREFVFFLGHFRLKVAAKGFKGSNCRLLCDTTMHTTRNEFKERLIGLNVWRI